MGRGGSLASWACLAAKGTLSRRAALWAKLAGRPSPAVLLVRELIAMVKIVVGPEGAVVGLDAAQKHEGVAHVVATHVKLWLAMEAARSLSLDLSPHRPGQAATKESRSSRRMVVASLSSFAGRLVILRSRS